MPTPIDPTRLPRLKKALGEYGEGEQASQQQLATVYGVTPARFADVKKRFPEFPEGERRGDKTHWYPARAAVGSMIAYLENTGKKAKAAAARHSAVMGHIAPQVAEAVPATPAPAGPEPLTAGELDRLASAQTRIFKLKKEQGLYTLTSEVHRIARGVNALLSREIMNLVNTIDPNGALTPLKRQALNNRCRDMVLKMHDMLGSFLEEDEDVGRSAGAIGSRDGAADNNRRRRPGGRADDMAGAA